MKKNDKKRIFVNSLVVTSSTIIEKVLFFAINVLIARYLSVEHFGEYTTALAYATFFAMLTNFGINNALVRAINLDAEHQSKHIGNALFFKFLLSAGMICLMLIILAYQDFSRETVFMVYLFAIVRFGNQFIATFYTLYEAKEKFLLPAFFVAFYSLLFLVLTYVVIILQGKHFDFAYVRVVIVVIFLIGIISFVVRDYSVSIDLTYFKRFFFTALPFGIYVVCQNFLHRINLILIANISGEVFTGVFNNAFIFFVTLYFIPANFGKVLLPFLYKISYIKEKEKFQFTYDLFHKMFAIMAFFAFLTFYLYSPTFIPLMLTEKYINSIVVLQIISFGVPFLFNVAPIIITSLDKQIVNTYILAVAAFVNIVSNSILIYLYRVEGAALATVITYFIMYVLSNGYLKVKGYIRIRMVLTNMFKLIILAVGLVWLHRSFLKEIHVFYSFLLFILFFAGGVVVLLLRKDDIRIIKETFFVKK